MNPAASPEIVSQELDAEPILPPENSAEAAPETMADADVARSGVAEAAHTETEGAAVAAAAAAPVAAPPARRRGGFFPLLFGGLIAGGIGFGVATYLQQQGRDGIADALAAQSARIDQVAADLAEIPPVDLSGIEGAQEALALEIDGVAARLDDGLAALDDGLAALDVRLADLENLPTGEGSISERAINAYEAELEALRAEMSELTGAARTELDAARAEAAAIEENAAAAARAAAGRAALARIQISLDNGEPLGAALGDLEDALGGPAPDDLLAAQDGVPTLAALQDGFGEVVGPALAAARSAGVSGEETSGLGAFLKNQFDVRSTTPQDGDSTDAVLSRAEAALRSGRLSDAIAELAALPEEARAAMTDWLGQAEIRAAAVAAVDILSTSLNDS